MKISRNDLIKEGDGPRLFYDSLSILIIAAGLFAAFAWNYGPDLGPQYINTALVQGAVILLLALIVMYSIPE